MTQRVDAEGLSRHRLFNDPTIYEARLFSRDYNRTATGAECCRVHGLWDWCEVNLKSPWMFHEGHDGGSFVMTAAEDAALFRLFLSEKVLYVRDPYAPR